MIIVNGVAFRTLKDEIFLGPKGVVPGLRTVSKTFSNSGYVLNVTSGPEDLRVIWTLYYNGDWWPNLVMYSTKEMTVSFNTGGSINSNQTASPITLGDPGGGGTFELDGVTYYYNGIDYNGRYTSNRLGWPEYANGYQEVAENYNSLSDYGTITGVLSSSEQTDTSNKVIEVYVNGVKVYPDSEGQLGDTIWWTANSDYVVEDADAELCYLDAGSYHRTYLKAYDGAAIFACVHFPGFNITEVIGISPSALAAAYKWPFNGPQLTDMRVAEGQYFATYGGAPFKISWYGGLYHSYGVAKDPYEWSYVPYLTIDGITGAGGGQPQTVLDYIAQQAGLRVSFTEVPGWYKSKIG